MFLVLEFRVKRTKFKNSNILGIRLLGCLEYFYQFAEQLMSKTNDPIKGMGSGRSGLGNELS